MSAHIRHAALATDTLRSISDAVVSTDALGLVEYLNPAAERLTGWTARAAIGRPLDSVMILRSEVTGEPIENLAIRCLREGRAIDLEAGVVLIRRDGSHVPIGDSAAPIYDQVGKLMGVVLVIRDESEQRRVGKRLSHEAAHDSLTGLTNRREFERRLAQLVAGLAGSTATHSVLYVDLDRFKEVNDTGGHDAGDALLCLLGPMMSRQLRTGDTLARLGGDEFGVLLPQCEGTQASQIAERIRAALEAFQFESAGVACTIGASIGVQSVDATSGGGADVVRAADAACYEAKRRGGNGVCVATSLPLPASAAPVYPLRLMVNAAEFPS